LIKVNKIGHSSISTKIELLKSGFADVV